MRTRKSINTGANVCKSSLSSALLALLFLLATPEESQAQDRPIHDGPGQMEERIMINVNMPMEKLNQQYTSEFNYSFPYNGGTVTFSAFYDPVDPQTGLTDLEYLNNSLAHIQADTLMTFLSASTNLGQTWWDFTLQIRPNNTYSTLNPLKAVEREINLIFPLSTGNILQINISQAKGADRPEPFPQWPDRRYPQTEPLIDHTHDLQQDSETLSNWIRKATYIGSDPYIPNDSIVDIVWYNGLGQQKQIVQVGAAANNGKNIVTPVEYDPVGQKLRDYLPYVSSSSSENYENATASSQMNYYHTLYGDTEYYPYTETLPEAVTGKPIVQYSQGRIFRDSASLPETPSGVKKPRSDANGRYLATTYNLSKPDDNIPVLLAEGGFIKNRGFFGQGGTQPLLKTVTTDPDGKTVATFTDEKEKTILVRTYLGGSADTTQSGGWSDLVYVYDSRGLLYAVITPEGEEERNKAASQISLDSEWAKKRCYIYKYDGLGRMTERRWPGKGKELFVSDPAGNVVATQDSLLRQSGRWHLTRYDRSNRPVETMLTQQSITEAQMRNYFSYETAQTFYSQNGNIPFTSSVYELTDNISLTKTEIGKTKLSHTVDGKTITFNPEEQTVSQTDVDTTKYATVLWERAAMTVSKNGELVGIAEDPNANPATLSQTDILYRYTAYFYDSYGRPVQTLTIYPDGSKLVSSIKYKFEGLPLRQVYRLTVPQGNCLTNASNNTASDTLHALLTETFSYDRRGRMLTSDATLKTFCSFIQNNTLTSSDTLSSTATAAYVYDELGHLTGKTLGGELTQTLDYNIQEWMTTTQTKKGTANIFSQTLRYYSPSKSNTVPLYSGNISEWESLQGTSAANTYGFTYDTQGRLVNSQRYEGGENSPASSYCEKDIEYDRNGNISALERYGASLLVPIHSFTYTYDGDKLTTLSGTQDGTDFISAYSYDGNGNMTMDGNQGSRLSYDINNLVFKVKKTSMQILRGGDGKNDDSNPTRLGPGGPGQMETLTGKYVYFADGEKFSVTGADGAGRIYIGPFTLSRKEYTDAITGDITALTILESAEALGADARFAFAATPQTTIGTDTTYTVDYETLYLVRDHLGSVRAVTDSQGNILERNDYYPYGLQTDLGRNYPAIAEKYRVKLPAAFSDYNHNNNGYNTLSSATEKLMPYRLLYNGKELQMIAQTRLVDYGARQYDPTIARWNAPDPMSEDSFIQTSFSYCKNSPILLFDIAGLAASTDVKDLGGGKYEVLDSRIDGSTDINIIDNGEKVGVLGQSMTEYSFMDEKGNPTKGAIIDMNDSSGNEFLQSIENIQLIPYALHASTHGEYDFKYQHASSLFKKKIEPTRDETMFEYSRAMPVSIDGKTVIATARDIGNYSAGYKAGQFAVPYFITRKIFDTLDYGKERVKDLWTSFKCILHSEPKVSKAAQELGYGNGFVKYNKINTQERIHLWSY